MSIEIIAVGNEILSGFTINTNAAFISQELLKLGHHVQRHMVLPDNAEALQQGMTHALEHSQVVIVTGGLGPTCDDITRSVAAKLFHSEFHYDEEIAQDLEKRYGSHLSTLIDQATVPSKAVILKNSLGTAPGMIFKDKGMHLVLLPGVPTEMKKMFLEQVVPFIKEVYQAKERHFSQRVHLFGLPESSVDPLLRKLQKQYPQVEFGIYPAPGLLSVHVLTHRSDVDLTPVCRMIKEAFQENVFESETGRMEDSIHQLFLKKGKTLSTAESCTGGLIASHLTHLPGASQYFLGSVVAYSNELKIKLLDVSAELLKQKGAVSEEVVAEMLKGILTQTGSDYGIAVSGIAGPTGGTPEKPVGTIFGAVGEKNKKPLIWKFQAFGNREMILEWTSNVVLGKLLQLIKKS